MSTTELIESLEWMLHRATDGRDVIDVATVKLVLDELPGVGT